MRNLILATAALVAAAAPASAQHCCGARHARPVAMVAMPVSYAAPVSYAPTFALPAPSYVAAAAPVQITSLQFAPMVAAPVQHVALTAAPPAQGAPKLGASADDPCARCMAELEKLRRVVETHTDVLTRHEDRLRALEKKAGIVPGG